MAKIFVSHNVYKKCPKSSYRPLKFKPFQIYWSNEPNSNILATKSSISDSISKILELLHSFGISSP
jgi:hypothetical protein